MKLMCRDPIGWLGSLVFWITVIGLLLYIFSMTVWAVACVEFPYLPEMLNRVLF